MKTVGICIFFLIFLIIPCWGREQLLKQNEIPEEITTYVAAYFKNTHIIRAVFDDDRSGTSYKILLDDNTSLEFNRQKAVTEIKTASSIPADALPEAIQTYISEQYAGEKAVEWELDRKKQSVKLTNGLELVFTLQGRFIKIDD